MIDIRELAEPDFAGVVDLDAAAFGYDPTRDDIDELALPLLRDGRIIGSFDAGRLTGVAAILDKDLTFPGARRSPVAAVTWVGVLPGEQGRGQLRALMRHQLHGLHDENGSPVAILTASEGGIYGRFGYGMAIPSAETKMSRALPLRPGVVVEPVRETPREDALLALREMHGRVAAIRTGYLSRDERSWNAMYFDRPSSRHGAGSLRFGVHPDGVVAFRIVMEKVATGPRHRLNIHEICAATPVAAASLWNFVLNRGLVGQVGYGREAAEPLLRDLVVNPRSVEVTTLDHIWLRIVDLDRAIPLRSYGDRAVVTVGILDAFCPWNEGCWQFDLGPDGGTATRTAEPAQLTLDIADLAATFLGGTRLARLAAAGRVAGDATAIAALDRALATPVAPYCPEGF